MNWSEVTQIMQLDLSRRSKSFLRVMEFDIHYVFKIRFSYLYHNSEMRLPMEDVMSLTPSRQY